MSSVSIRGELATRLPDSGTPGLCSWTNGTSPSGATAASSTTRGPSKKVTLRSSLSSGIDSALSDGNSARYRATSGSASAARIACGSVRR